MFVKIVIFFCFLAVAKSAPGFPLVAPARVALAAPPFVTSHSSQVVARNHNAFAAPLVSTVPVVSPAVAAPVLPGAPIAAYSAPFAAAYSAPFAAAPYTLGAAPAFVL